MPLINKQPFIPNPIPDNLDPEDEVFYHELTNEIFTSHDAFFDRFLFCNSLIWTCSRTGKSNLTYREALDSEQQETVKKGKKRVKKDNAEVEPGEDGQEPVKKKKKKYPYDPKKYAMPVPDGFDPSLLTPTGKIDGRKLKSKKNKQLAEELLLHTIQSEPSESSPGKKGKHKRKDDDSKKKGDDTKKKEEESKRKAQLQAELAKERELEAKRKKEAATLARQMERQKREEERKRAATFLQNWEKKCEDLERDDLRRLPQPVPLNCDIPDRLFGDALFIMESLYNLHEVFNFTTIYPDGMTFDTLEEVLFEKQEEGPLGTLIQFLLKTILDTQPTGDGYGLDDDPSRMLEAAQIKVDQHKTTKDESTDIEPDNDQPTNGLGSEHDEDEGDDSDDKEVKMNDLIGSAIRAALEVKMSLNKPLPEMELNSTTVTEILRLHLLQSGSFPKGRTIYNGWYSSREDPGLWLCMQEPDLIKKLSELSIYQLDIEERIKILHTLIYQLFTFIRTRTYIESASESLTELRKKYRKEAADFARWDRENCVKRMQPPKKKGDQEGVTQAQNTLDKTNGHLDQNIKSEPIIGSHPSSINGDNVNETETDFMTSNIKVEKESGHKNINNQLKSCLKTNGTLPADLASTESDELPQNKKKITFKTGSNGAIVQNGPDGGQVEPGNQEKSSSNCEENEQCYEELERNFQQNLVDYEDYQRERAIRLEELNQTLVSLRSSLRMNQSVYGIHPIGRDRAYRRYWLFQSVAGLFVEQDDEYVGKCLPEPTPLESRYKKLFNKENPLMHPNEMDLIRTKTCDVACSTEPVVENQQNCDPPMPREGDSENNDEPDNMKQESENGCPGTGVDRSDNGDHDDNQISDKLFGGDQSEDQDDHQEVESTTITDEMSICTGDEKTCAVHGVKRPSQVKWWFYHSPESIDRLVECLNKRGFRESELQEVLSAESSIIKPRILECPAFKLSKDILEAAGIRRSRRLRTKGSKKRGRNYERD